MAENRLAARKPQTQRAQDYWRRHIRPSDRVLDATAGRGHDTVFLAGQVGPSGHVWAVDSQPEAVASTEQRLASAGLRERVSLICADHAGFPNCLPISMRGELALTVFNLGYLPGSASATTTLVDSTLAALYQALEWLKPDGMLSVLCYPGHAQGAVESEAVKRWILRSRPAFSTWIRHRPIDCKAPPPELHILTKSG